MDGELALPDTARTPRDERPVSKICLRGELRVGSSTEERCETSSHIYERPVRLVLVSE